MPEGLRTAWLLRGQWGADFLEKLSLGGRCLPRTGQGRQGGECSEDQVPEPGKSMVY